MMIKTGLVSITFRQHAPGAIVEMVAAAGLDAIEWGGDVHVPHGDLAAAEAVKAMCEQTNIATPSYGSYYRVGHHEPVDFSEVLNTAAALDAKTIRVWAGKKSPADADETYWRMVSDDARRIADLAAAKNITVSFEFHGNTLTETNESAARFFEMTDHPNLRSYWQPPVDADDDYCIEGLKIVSPYLSHLHVFHWAPGHEKHLIADGAERWGRFLKLADALGRPEPRVAFIEFVKDGAEAAFNADARTLKSWVASLDD